MIQLPWYIAGPLIGAMVPVLLVVKNRQFGISSTFRVAGSYVLPRLKYFQYERSKDAWQIPFCAGIALLAAGLFLLGVDVAPEIRVGQAYANLAGSVYDPENWLLFLVGGLCIGFGARYADGCTAGHCIMGNALFARSSLITTLAFFAGGLLTSHILIPFIFSS